MDPTEEGSSRCIFMAGGQHDPRNAMVGAAWSGLCTFEASSSSVTRTPPRAGNSGGAAGGCPAERREALPAGRASEPCRVLSCSAGPAGVPVIVNKKIKSAFQMYTF